MADFTAKDVQALRQATGAGIMDAKRALSENGGDPEAATKWLREKGLSKAAGRTDRDNSEGVVAAAVVGSGVALVELKCETDFVAKSDSFAPMAQEIADAVAAKGEGALADFTDKIDDLKVVLKEHIELGKSVAFTAAEDSIVDIYVHRQDGRGVNAVAVELSGGTAELAHDIAGSTPQKPPPAADSKSHSSRTVSSETSSKISRSHRS